MKNNQLNITNETKQRPLSLPNKYFKKIGKLNKAHRGEQIERKSIVTIVKQLKKKIMNIIGRVTRDAEVHTTPQDKKVVNFSVAINDS